MRAPVRRARPTPVCSAFAVMSEPSVGIRMRWYMAGSSGGGSAAPILPPDSTARHRARRVGAPLAPRAGVEPAAGESGVLHREQVVARGDAAAALVDDVAGRRCPGVELRAQHVRRLE